MANGLATKTGLMEVRKMDYKLSNKMEYIPKKRKTNS